MNFRELLLAEGATITKDKGEYIFMKGDRDRSLYYIKKGLLKAYYLSETGKESVKSFLLAEDIIGSLSASHLNNSCSFNLVCLEKTTLVRLPFDTLYKKSKQNLDLASDMIDLLLQFAMKKEKREFDLLSMSAEERYRELILTTPALLAKVTQSDLSRYLGITPVALSRIKKRVKDLSRSELE